MFLRQSLQRVALASGLFVFLGFGLFVDGAQAQSTRDLINRLNRLENEMDTMSRAVYRGEKPSGGATNYADVRGGSSGSTGGGENNAAMEVRMQQLESDMQALTGRLEEVMFKIDAVQKKMDTMGSDTDIRLNDLENAVRGTGASPVGNGANAASQYYNSGGSNSAAQDSSVVTNPLTGSGDGYQWNSGNSISVGVPPNGNTISTPEGLYQKAFSELSNKNFEEAEGEFKDFLQKYPDHELAGNAHYWLAETYYVRNNYATASRLFAEAYQKYPKNNKAPDNLLKLGMSLAGLDKTKDACVALGQLKKEYSENAPLVVERGEQVMTSIGCGA